jgi:hypothetical protein
MKIYLTKLVKVENRIIKTVYLDPETKYKLDTFLLKKQTKYKKN